MIILVNIALYYWDIIVFVLEERGNLFFQILHHICHCLNDMGVSSDKRFKVEFNIHDVNTNEIASQK